MRKAANKIKGGTLILAVLPGLGKTTLAKKYPSILDLDHIYYQYLDPPSDEAEVEVWKGRRDRELNPEYPQNFIAAVNQSLPKYDIVLIPFVGEGECVADYLIDNGYNCRTVICEHDMLEEIFDRFRNRGNPPEYVEDAIKLASPLIDYYSQPKYRPIMAKQGEYLIDILKREGFIKDKAGVEKISNKPLGKVMTK